MSPIVHWISSIVLNCGDGSHQRTVLKCKSVTKQPLAWFLYARSMRSGKRVEGDA